MSQGGFKHNLITNYSADVAKFSNLMGNVESATVGTIKAKNGNKP